MPLSTLAASAVIAASAASAGGASLPVPVAVPLTQVQAPSFQVGQEWEFSFVNELDPSKTGGYTQRVVSVADGLAELGVVVKGSVGRGELDANANVVRAPQAVYSPSNEMLRFPLYVGKSWEAQYTYTSGNWTANDDRSAKVVAIERVQTAAGTFDAFRIESTIAWAGASVSTGAGHAHETDWYAPAVGRVVKQEYEDVPNNKNEAPTATRYELVRYSPARAAGAQ
ncbi:hypothetical protein PQR53_20985 [Paraburkholderia fungorum]|jgi:hypothetical protein|uniref:TapB family protein n=1 Tax=Paraburkholderia fungorum TaxID=134537 RepID=UPI0038BBB4AB